MHLYTNNRRWSEAMSESLSFGQGVGLDVNGQKLQKSAEKEKERKDITTTPEGTPNRSTQIHNDTTLNTCNMSRNVSMEGSDATGLKGSCDAAKSHG